MILHSPLTPTKLEFVSIENADFLPAGAIPLPPTVEEGSVKFNAVVLTGTGEGDGTLAVATFRVLVKTETTIGLENIEIGDPEAELLTIASVIGATINSTSSTTDLYDRDTGGSPHRTQHRSPCNR